jgi:hypothetical protein
MSHMWRNGATNRTYAIGAPPRCVCWTVRSVNHAPVDQSNSGPSCIFGSNKRFGDDQPRLLQKERVGVANSVSVVRLGGLCEKVFVLRVGFGGCGVPESGCRWGWDGNNPAMWDRNMDLEDGTLV